MIKNIIKTIKLPIIILLSIIFLTACALTNPYKITNSSFATLENWAEKVDSSHISYFFNGVDGDVLEEGLFKARLDAKFKIPLGPRKLNVYIVYAPHGLNKFGGSFKFYKAYANVAIEAKEGKIYRTNATIRGLLARIWVEEAGGEIVSNIEFVELVPYWQFLK